MKKGNSRKFWNLRLKLKIMKYLNKKIREGVQQFLKILLLIVFIFTYSLNFAQNITKNEVIEVTKNWLNFKGKSLYEIENIYEEYENDVLVLYIVDLKPTGFIILSSDSDIVPILAYSFSNDATENIENETTKKWIESYSKVINEVITLKLSYNENNKKWSNLLNNNFQDFTKSKNVTPLISTNWGQGTVWNQYCPEDAASPDGHTWVGCVAVAMGQIMKKWDHPAQGIGS